MSAHIALLLSHDALARICDHRLLHDLAYIDGHWTAGANGNVFAVVDPATGTLVRRVASLDVEETASAIDAASLAFKKWRALLPQERAALLRAWYELIRSAKEDLALLVTLEQGKPFAESRDEIDYAASFVEWYAEEATRLCAESVVSHLRNADTIVRREAVGVVGVVTPWNFPSAMLTRKAAAALAAGCTIVAHPSSETPLSALAVAELGARAGLPAGTFNVVTGKATTIVGRLCEDVRVRAISFTGSTDVGRSIAAQCAPTMKRLVMELGGHAPLIVFDDADLDRAVDIGMEAKFTTSGQDCLAANRIYAQRTIYEAFCDAYAGRIRALKVGRGLDDGVQIGPLIRAAARARIEEHIADAIRRGARLLAGGKPHPAGELFFEPTLLVDVPDDALIMRDETFGPVASVAMFDTEAEVIARANATEYGLVAYVVTENGARQRRMSRALDYGMVAVNRAGITGAPIPFGGVKLSGLGREGSRHGMNAFTELKYICFDNT
jgi:aspartate-semialdehyde dehydrogenase